MKMLSGSLALFPLPPPFTCFRVGLFMVSRLLEVLCQEIFRFYMPLANVSLFFFSCPQCVIVFLLAILMVRVVFAVTVQIRTFFISRIACLDFLHSSFFSSLPSFWGEGWGQRNWRILWDRRCCKMWFLGFQVDGFLPSIVPGRSFDLGNLFFHRMGSHAALARMLWRLPGGVRGTPSVTGLRTGVTEI